MSSVTRSLITALAAAFAAQSVLAAGGGLATINPRLKTSGIDLAGYVKKPTATTVTVPKSFLDKTYLYGGMVEAATENILTIGSGSSVIKVRFEVEGDHLLMLADQRDRVPSIGASSQVVVNRYPMAEVGDDVEIDFSRPEVGGITFMFDSTSMKAERPGYIYDVVNEPGFLAYGEKYVVQGEKAADDLPGTITVAIKFFLKEVQETSYQAKEYSEEDFSRFGYFTTSRKARDEGGAMAERDFADRWDLSKKIVYTLHPSIPEKFRQAFREAILSWNQVFKKTHGLEPVEVVMGSDSDIPGNFGTNVLYWVDYETPYGGGAIGPHNSHPDTGEILDADVVFYADAFRDEIRGMRKEAERKKELKDAEAAESAETAEIRDLLRNAQKPEKRASRDFVMRIGGHATLHFSPGCEFPVDESLMLTAKAHTDISAMSDDEAMDRIIREVIPHEVGHTLGLRHNFGASSDAKNLPEGQTSTTVMEYQISLQSLVAPGPYDYAAIAYGYEGDASFHEGTDFIFSTDGTNAVDPRSNQFDLGDSFEFYTSRYKHFQKLREAGLIRSLASYSRAQRGNLEVIRKFVNRDDKSKEAFKFLLEALTAKSPEPPFNAIERLAAMSILMTDRPPTLGRYSPNATYEEYSEAQNAQLAAALLKNVMPGGEPDIFELRLAMFDALRGMNNIYGYKALEALDKGYDGFQQPPAEGEEPVQLPPRELELALRVKQAVKSYFER